MATTINTKAIVSLPGSRSTLEFVQFLPGVQTPGGTRDSQINGLPQSAISITLDGVNIQDNTLKSSDGFFAIVSPRLDAIEEVTVTSAAQGADANGQGAVQIRFTTRSGSNTFSGSAYHFYRSDRLNSNSYSNKIRGLPKGPTTLHQPGFRVGGPVMLPGLYDGRGQLFFFVNYEESRSPNTTTTTSTLLLADAQRGIFRYTNGPAEGIDLYALAARNGHTVHARSDHREAVAGHPRRDLQSGDVRADQRQPERGTLHVPAGHRLEDALSDSPHGLQPVEPASRVVHGVPPGLRQFGGHDQRQRAHLARFPRLRCAGIAAKRVYRLRPVHAWRDAGQ